MKEREKGMRAGVQKAERFLCDRHLGKVSRCMVLLVLLRVKVLSGLTNIRKNR